MNFPFPKLLAFLDREADQLEFMKIAAEVGLGSGDIELAKLLLALQLYKAYYASIPRQIKAVHEEALNEIRRFREDVESISGRASSDAVKIGQWTQEILRSLQVNEPSKIAEVIHKQLLEDTMKILGGSLQAYMSACGQIDKLTKRLDAAAYQAATAIEIWQTISLRRVWASALACCLVLSVTTLTGIWYFYLRHQDWWHSLQ